MNQRGDQRGSGRGLEKREPLTQLGGLFNHLGGSLSQLVESHSYLGKPWTIWKGSESAMRVLEPAGTPGERGGQRQTR